MRQSAGHDAAGKVGVLNYERNSCQGLAPGLVEHEGQNAPKALSELQLKERSIKRLQTPDDLMGTLVFLCSSDSDFMTGQAIVVDGGSVFH